MEKFLNKKYKLVKTENYDKLLAEIGMNSLTRKIAKTLTSSTQKLVAKPNNCYAFKTKFFKIMKHSLEFKPGEEFYEKTRSGGKVKSVVTFENDSQMIHIQHGDKPLKIVRTFMDTELVAVTTYGDVICTSWSKLVE